jgi:glucose/arabinose dehydrogenase
MRLSLLPLLAFAFTAAAQQTPHTLTYAPGRSITLSLPAELDIAIAATGIKRARFFAQAPDGRIFVTSMVNLADNTNGAIYILDGWNAETHTFTHVIPYLQHLRNPNNIAFYTDDAQQTWLYLPLTDRLVRYKYNPGDKAPSGQPQLLTTFPDYGLNYKYGGWHLTRTIAIATIRAHTDVYITTGSSCNYCREREAVRASLSVMDTDGGHLRIVAHGLRNAVDLRYVPEVNGGALFATNMGDDHLGDRLPEDTFFELDSEQHLGPFASLTSCRASASGSYTCVPVGPVPNYGWPTCYFANGKATLDTTPLPTNPGPNDKTTAPKPASSKDSVYGKQTGVATAGTNLAAQIHSEANLPDLGPVPAPLTSCTHVPAAYTTFAAHSSPLGLAYFGAGNPILAKTFLVALHGASHPHIGTGYRVVRFSAANRKPRDFITGFLTREAGKPIVHGRPCGLLRIAPDTFLLTDDTNGLVYVIFPKR